jgi:hypothetical protein
LTLWAASVHSSGEKWQVGFDSPAQRVVDADAGLHIDGCENGVGEGAAHGAGQGVS